MWYNAKVAVQTLNLNQVHVADFGIGTSREHVYKLVYT